MKPEHAAFIREVAEITAMLEKLNDLIGEFVVAPPGCEAVLRIEIEDNERAHQALRPSLPAMRGMGRTAPCLDTWKPHPRPVWIFITDRTVSSLGGRETCSELLAELNQSVI